MQSTNTTATNIFTHQQELINRFHHIERQNFPHTYPHPTCQDLDDPQAQARIRDYAWRITEEMVEYLTAPTHHKQEELIDVLHFVAELFIFLEIPAHSLSLGDPQLQFDPEPTPSPLDILLYLGQGVNTLKNKAWKQSHKVTDSDSFYNNMRAMWSSLQRELSLLGLSPTQIEEAYLGKAAINHNRIQTGV